jgi:hypothetical protein
VYSLGTVSLFSFAPARKSDQSKVIAPIVSAFIGDHLAQER